MVCGPFLVSTVTSPLTVPAFNSVRICLSACASLPRAVSAAPGLVPSPVNEAAETPERPSLAGFEVAALATPVRSTPVPAMPAATRAKRRWWLRRFIEGPSGRGGGPRWVPGVVMTHDGSPVWCVDPRIGRGHVRAVGRVYGSCKPATDGISSGETAARNCRLSRPANRGDHVEHLPGLANLMRAEDARPLPRGDRSRCKGSAEPLVGCGVERLADELLVR